MRQVGIENTGGNRIDADAKGSRFTRKAFGKADHRGFRGGVVNRRRQRAHSANRSDIQYLSFALPDHLLVYRLGYSKQAADIGANYFVPGAIGCSSEIIAAIDGRIVYQTIDAAPFSDELPGQMFHAETIGHGHFERMGPAPVRFDLLAHFVRQIVARTIIECHVSAFARKYFAKCGPDAPRAAGYERPLAFE